MPIGCQAYTQRRQHTRQQEIIRDTEQNSACACAELHAAMSMGRNEYGIARQKLGLPPVTLRLAAADMDDNIRSKVRREGTQLVCTGRLRWSRKHKKKKTT